MTETFGDLPPEEGLGVPEKERLPAERFDDARYEKAKIEYDPLHKLLKDEAGLSEEEIAGFNIKYRTVESIELIKPEDNPKFEGQTTAEFRDFSNYHNLLVFRKKLEPEKKELFDSKIWGKGDGWNKIGVFAVDFWDRVDKPEDKLYQFRDKIYEINGKIKNEELDDEYAKAVAEGKIEPIKDPEDLGKKEPAEPEQPSEEHEIPETPEEKLFRDFQETFNVKKEELESIGKFATLSLGQQVLVLENLKQVTLGRIEDEAVDRYSKGTIEKVAKYTAAAADAKFFGKIWHRMQAMTTGAWRSALRGFHVAREEKRTAEEILHGGMATHGNTIMDLVYGMAENGPEVAVKETGEIEILYAGKFENLTDDEQRMVSRCNIAAGKFATIPQEWSLPSATKKQQNEYNKAKTDYKTSIDGILPLKERSLGNERDAALAVADIERKVLFNQLLSRSPDVERKLKDIESDEVWARALNNVITERGLYAGFGYVARAATASVFGLIAAPAVAAVVGGHIARRRAFETLHQEEKLGRRGAKEEKADVVGLKNESKVAKEGYRAAQEAYEKRAAELGIELSKFEEGGFISQSSEKKLSLLPVEQRDEIIELHKKAELALQNASRVEAMLEDKQKGEKAFVSATILERKLGLLLSQLNAETDNEKKAEIRGSLEARIDYAYDKLDKGLVNFGKTQEQLAGKYELLLNLSFAGAEVAVKKSELTKAKDEKGLTVTERLNRLTGAREARVTEAEKKFVNQQMIRGAIMGAGFAVLGYSIRHFFWGAPKHIEASHAGEGVPPPEVPPQTPRTFFPAAPDTGTTYEFKITAPLDTNHLDTVMTANLMKSGVPADSLLKAGFPPDVLYKAGVPADSLLKSGVPVDTLIKTGVPPDSLLKAGVTLDSLIKAGVPVDTLIKAGIPPDSLLKAGVTPDSLIKAGAPIDTLIKAGIPPDSLLKAGVTPDSLVKAGVPPDSLIKAGVSPDSLAKGAAPITFVESQPVKASPDSLLSILKSKHPEFARDSTFKFDSTGVGTRVGYPGTYAINQSGDIVYGGGKLPDGTEYAPQVLKAASTVWQELPPEATVGPEQLKLAVIGKGEGVWHAVYRQLSEQARQSPAKFNLKPEDLNDPAKLKSILNRETARILVDNKIIRSDGSEIRMSEPGSRVILDANNEVKIVGKTYDWHPPKVKEEFNAPLKGLRDTQWIDNQKMSILGNPSIMEKAGISRWLFSDAADTYKGAVGGLNDLAYVRGLSALEQENLFATGLHGAAQLDQWGLKPGTGGSFTSHFDSVLNSSKINELTQHNVDVYNDISKRVASASGIEWAKAGRMRVSDMIRWSKEPINLKPGTFRLVETVSKFNPTRYEQTLTLDELLKSKIHDGKTDFLKVLESTPKAPVDTIGVSHQGGAGSHAIDEALQKPGTGYDRIDEALQKPGTGYNRIDEVLEPESKPPLVEQVVTGKGGVEQIAPGEFSIKSENMTGVVKFIYNNEHNPVKIDADITMRNSTGLEFFKSDVGVLGEKTITDGRLLSQYLEVYDKISKNPAYQKESSFLAKAIKFTIKNITKDAGDIINTEKLPDKFRS